MERISEEPFLYKLMDGVDEAPTYLTAVRECGVHVTTPSAATTRQLLVGFRDITVRSQDYQDIAGRKVLVSSLDAVLDASPVSLLGFTVRRDRCVSDLLFWRFREASQESHPQQWSRIRVSAPSLLEDLH